MFLAFQFQSPGPIIFEIGPLALRWYGLLIASAVLIGVSLSQYLAQRRGVDPELIGDLTIWLVIAAIPCARIYYVLFEWEQYASHPEDIIAIWKGGIAIHGAIIGGTIAALIFSRLNKVSVWQLIDLIVPSLILGQAIGRWGNFFNSEAFGRPTDVPWKLFIPPANRPLDYLNYDYFHPTFLYESVWNLGVFALLLGLFFWGIKKSDSARSWESLPIRGQAPLATESRSDRKIAGKFNRLKVGTLTCLYLIAYSLGRFWIEALRTDSLMFGFLRIAQIVSLGAIAIGVFGLVWLYIFKRPLPDTVKNHE